MFLRPDKLLLQKAGTLMRTGLHPTANLILFYIVCPRDIYTRLWFVLLSSFSVSEAGQIRRIFHILRPDFPLFLRPDRAGTCDRGNSSPEFLTLLFTRL